MSTSVLAKTAVEHLLSQILMASKVSNQACMEVVSLHNLLVAQLCHQVFLSITVVWLQVLPWLNRERKVSSTINKRANSISLSKTH
jgi:hypothetical protein